ncbi:hypothetical protein F7725_023565 [Dissostichus mawsoni]|uniref:Uncharacterized protein n=1 Tax=Dissostichus mawsoni TaxID=36200 RepID=A0A7J5XWX1_DISMA|nr:hypothetical protein F7725_023565 [Dissostichus mawsoni]
MILTLFPIFASESTEEFWGQRSEVFHRTSFSSPTDLEIRQEPASSGSSKKYYKHQILLSTRNLETVIHAFIQSQALVGIVMGEEGQTAANIWQISDRNIHKINTATSIKSTR